MGPEDWARSPAFTVYWPVLPMLCSSQLCMYMAVFSDWFSSFVWNKQPSCFLSCSLHFEFMSEPGLDSGALLPSITHSVCHILPYLRLVIMSLACPVSQLLTQSGSCSVLESFSHSFILFFTHPHTCSQSITYLLIHSFTQLAACTSHHVFLFSQEGCGHHAVKGQLFYNASTQGSLQP